MDINKAKVIYESITLKIDEAIDSEVGCQNVYKPETDLILTLIHEQLIDALGLPEDHHL